MPREVKTLVYTYAELSEQAKARARDWYRETQTGPEDFEFIREDVETVLGILGVELRYHTVNLMGGGTRQEPNIWWQVGYCQSDGASFEGIYTYGKGAHRKIWEHAPEDTVLHDIADRLFDLQRRNRYQAYARVIGGRDFYPEVETGADTHDLSADDHKELQEIMRDLCGQGWIYQQFRAEDESRSEDAYVAERLEEGEYEFTESGRPV